MKDEKVKTYSPAEAMDLLKWCVQAGPHPGPHPSDDGWLMVFEFENGLQATVAYGSNSNGLSVGVKNGESTVESWDWLEAWEVVARLVEVKERLVEVEVKEQAGDV